MMKKIIGLCLMLLLICQLVSAIDLTIGIKGGLNASGLYGENYWDLLNDISTLVFGDAPYGKYVIPLSYQFGGYICLGIVDFLAIQTEAYYTRIGDLAENEHGIFENMSDYIEFTALLAFRLGNNVTAFSIFAGPDFLWNIDGKADINVYDNNHHKLATVTIDEDSINRWLMGIAMGFGFNINIDKFILSFDVRYVAPLQKIYNNNVPYKDYGLVNFQILVQFVLLFSSLGRMLNPPGILQSHTMPSRF
jgi:hypothetical protein